MRVQTIWHMSPAESIVETFEWDGRRFRSVAKGSAFDGPDGPTTAPSESR
jgi:hypothetical protein